MPLSDSLDSFQIRLTPGQNTTTRDTLLENTHVEQSQNTRYDVEVGSVSKRPQAAFYNTTSLGSNGIHSLFRYYTIASKFLLAGYLGTLKVGTDATGTFADLVTGLTSDKPHTFAVYKDLCLFSNGFDDIYQTDGSAAWELGSCKATLGSGAGNLDASAAYSYQITIDSDAYICGAVSNTVTTDGSNQQIELSNIPLGPVGTVDRKIYRTEGGGSTYYLIATLSDNTTTTYTDNIADTTATVLPAVTDDMPKGRYLKIYRERLFIARNEANPNRIHYSNAFLPHYIQATSNLDYADIAADDGDVITGIPIVLGSMKIFKRNTIRPWHISGNADPDSWVVDDPVSFDGSPAPRSIAQTPYGIVYQGWSHLMLFDGAGSKPVIDEFDFINDVKADSRADSVGFWHDQAYLYSYVASGSGVDYRNRTMRFNWLRNTVSVDTISAASFTSYVGDAESGELYYGDSQLGYVYLAENYERAITLETITDLNGGLAYPASIFTGLDDIALKGSEDDPIVQMGWSVKIDDAVGTINAGYSGTATIDQRDTAGTYTSDVFLINASSLGKIFWNEVLPAGTDVIIHTRTGATVAATEAAGWSAGLSVPGGSTIASTADVYFQFKAELTSGAVTVTPQITKVDGYVFKFTYTPGGSEVTDNTPFVYGTGNRNFGRPDLDKIYKKLITRWSGIGTVTIAWETENASGSWNVDLSTHPTRWESFFPDTAFGRDVKFTISKNDTTVFTLKEILGLYTPRPLII